MNDFLRGALVMASFTIGLFFVRYWRSTRDRLFLFFTAAFWLLALNWLLTTLSPALAPQAHFLRFTAFALIAGAIVDKNRNSR